MDAIQKQLRTSAERIAFELAARAGAGVPITCDATISWIERELLSFVMHFGVLTAVEQSS